jgi:hypothetical protein
MHLPGVVVQSALHAFGACACHPEFSGVARQQERARGGEVLAEKTARSVLCKVQGVQCGENAQRRYAVVQIEK